MLSAAKPLPVKQLNPANWALLLITPLLFASNVLGACWVQRAAVPPVFLAFARWSMAVLVLTPFVARRLWVARAQIRPLFWNCVLVGGIGMGLAVVPQYIGAHSTTATNIALIFSAAPIMVVILESILRREMPSGCTLAGIALALLGILVILGKGDPRAVLNLTFGAGDVWIVLADVGWALYTVMLKRIELPKVDSFSRIALLMMGAVIVLAPCAALEAAGGRTPTFNAVTVASIAFLAVIPGIFGFMGYVRLIAQTGETTASTSCYLIPFYTAIIAWPLLGEMPHAFHLAGVPLILSGLWLVTTSRRSAAQGVRTTAFNLPAAALTAVKFGE